MISGTTTYRHGDTVVIDVPSQYVELFLDTPLIVDILEEHLADGEELERFNLRPGEKLRLTFDLSVLRDSDIVDDLKEPHKVPLV